MSGTSRVAAVLAYIPIIGWLYVLLLQRKNALAMFHLRQSVGLVVFLVGTLVVWAIIFWLLSWIPYFAVLGIALFTLVMTAYFFGVVALIMGLINALSNKSVPLPLVGQWASRLPIN